jgi:uncharacterized membrane protein
VSLRRTLHGVTLLAVIGLGISLYLSWVYLSGGTPLCGGSTGCASVQASPYARVGAIPVPVLGAVGYSVILALALLAQGWSEQRHTVMLVLFGTALVGLLFSAYLTYVEFFVIDAVCRWCVASAVDMALLFILTVAAYRQAEA